MGGDKPWGVSRGRGTLWKATNGNRGMGLHLYQSNILSVHETAASHEDIKKMCTGVL